jgi:ribosomal protein S18 acetylase RimI-like enzyme
MRWADPAEGLVYYVAANIRREDEREVWLSHHIPGPEAVVESWVQSDICRCIVTDDGEPVGVTGVVGDRIWLLGTEELTATRSRRLQLCREGRGWVEHCLKRVGGPIGNDVYHSNQASIRWLKHLGFTVEQPRPFGSSGALFCNFWRAA